jgi:hypothetical protein
MRRRIHEFIQVKTPLSLSMRRRIHASYEEEDT